MVREQVDHDGLTGPPVRRQLQYGRTTEPPMGEEDVLFKSRPLICHPAVHAIARKYSEPLGILARDGHRPQRRRRGHSLQPEPAGGSEGEVAPSARSEEHTSELNSPIAT